MSGSRPGRPGDRSTMASTKVHASLTAISPNSPMFLPAMVTAREPGLSRSPLHSGHSATTMYASSSARIESLVVSLYRRCTFARMPSHFPASSWSLRFFGKP